MHGSLLGLYTVFAVFAVLTTREEAGALREPKTPTDRPRKRTQSDLQPTFYDVTRTTVDSAAGSTVFLHCAIKQLGDKTVSWIRKEDIHILTVGTFTYTKDLRFQCLHDEGSNEWVLRIVSAQVNDSGTYDCQINTEPKMSLSFVLRVFEPKVEILGDDEVYLRRGSTLLLTCLSRPRAFGTRWYWDREELSLNKVQDDNSGSSILRIDGAEVHHSGQYTCRDGGGQEDSVRVHVFTDEPQAAVHYVSSGRLLDPTPSLLLLLLVLYELSLSGEGSAPTLTP